MNEYRQIAARKDALKVAARIAHHTSLESFVAPDPVARDLYGYIKFVPNTAAIRKVVDNHWKLRLPEYRFDAFDIILTIVDERLAALPA